MRAGRGSFLRRAGLALTLLLASSVPWSAMLHSADSADSIVPRSVHDRALRAGRVRVLVELRLPAGSHVPEGALSPAAITVQRRDIGETSRRVLARLAAHDHRVLRRYASVALVALEVGAAGLTELEASGVWVKRVVEDTINAPSLSDSVPLIGADQAWALGFDGTGTVVAVGDTGVQSNHPFLAGKVVEEACYSSTVAGSSTSLCPNGLEEQVGPGAGVSCSLPGCWHGTHVAGIAAGNGAVAGVSFSGVAKGAKIMAVQIFSRFDNSQDCGGSPPCALAWTSDIIAGLERVYLLRGVRNFASVNLSLGGGSFTSACDEEPEKAIIDNLRSVGIATVVAAGNDGSTNALNSPACISSAISVGATTKTDAVASFTNAASFMSLFAPGVSIYSSVAGGGFGFTSGTSMATPHVAGAWAVLKQGKPGATVDQILGALQSTGKPITDTRSGGALSKPRIRVDQALAALGPGPSAPAEIIIDNGTAGTSSTGTWCGSAATNFYGADSLYSCGGGVNTYRWTPTIGVAATYDVYVWWTTHPNRSTSVPITVVHAAGSAPRTFNQQTGGGLWVLHGRYTFNAGTAGYVQVSSANGQAAADAVRLVPAP